jgi:hypothetical protein
MAADTAIYFTLNHNALYYWQSQDRLHRPGQQGKKVVYYHLEVPHSVDQLVRQSLQEKLDLKNMILHNPRKMLRLL